MALTNQLKEFIHEQCGSPAVGIAPVDDLTAEETALLQRLNRIMSRYTPLYSAESPVFQPGDFLDNARAVIVLGFNVFFGRNDTLPGNPPRGEIMNFYVNPDCLAYITTQTDKIHGFLTEQGYTGASLASGIPLKILSARSGMGRYGKNGVIQAPALGSWLGITGIITGAPLEPDSPLADACGTCNLCQQACPTGALEKPYVCDIERCLTLHMVNNKGSIPYEIREKAGTCITHCNVCLDACPKNKKLSLQTDISNPEDLVYPEIAPLVNMTDEYYQKIFGGTFLEFMFVDKKYLQRNAAIALGNYGDATFIAVLIEALETQSEEDVRIEAAWALGRIGSPEAKTALQKFKALEQAPAVLSEITYALESL